MLGLVSENERRPGRTAAESHPLCIQRHKTPGGGGSGRSRRNVIGLTKGGKSGIIIIMIKKLQLVHFAGEPTSSEAANYWQQRQNSPAKVTFDLQLLSESYCCRRTHSSITPHQSSAGESFLLPDWLELPTEVWLSGSSHTSRRVTWSDNLHIIGSLPTDGRVGVLDQNLLRSAGKQTRAQRGCELEQRRGRRRSRKFGPRMEI